MSRTQYNINQNLNNSQGKRQSTDDNPMMTILELPNKDFKAGIVTMFHEGRANSLEWKDRRVHQRNRNYKKRNKCKFGIKEHIN